MDLVYTFLENGGTGGWKKLAGDEEMEAAVRPLLRTLASRIPAEKVDGLPLLALRAEELVVAWLTVRRMEDVLRTEGVCLCEHAPNAGDAQDKKRAVFKGVHPLVEKAAKARDRLRKALKEFEDARTGPADAGGTGALADQAGPLLRLGQGVLDDALAFEQRKKKRTPAKKSAAARAKRSNSPANDA
jgi:hypothetical protein